MILKSELTGSRLKKALGFHRGSYQWHNRNKSGGNFGINLYPTVNGGWQRESYMLSGAYNSDGIVTALSFCEGFSAGVRLSCNQNTTFAGLIYQIDERIKTLSQFRKAIE